MLTIAYLANQFPAAVERYVADEVSELEGRGVCVIATSMRKTSSVEASGRQADLVLLPISVSTAISAFWFFISRFTLLAPFLIRILFRGSEGAMRRCKALLHTFLGACLAARLKRSGVEHVHVHHGYFGSWVGMVAARLVEAGFSFTLHGSDLLLHGVYLDAKLAACNFCVTVSEYNRRFIVERYPWALDKVLVSRLGVAEPKSMLAGTRVPQEPIEILSVGRLHVVKDHAFLLQACARMVKLGIPFTCSIAGDGPERQALERLIRDLGLSDYVKLLRHVEHERLGPLYDKADVVVLTSRSEGIPIVLMEAMARGRIVLAPAITGIPELVIPGKTGFLYESGSIEDFMNQLVSIRALITGQLYPQAQADAITTSIREAARIHIAENFNQQKNLQRFAELFLSRIARKSESTPNEDLILQQI